MKTFLLDEIKVGERATINKILLNGGIKNRLINFGFIRGEEVIFLSKSILGDPKAFLIKGGVVAIRRSDCKKIIVNKER